MLTAPLAAQPAAAVSSHAHAQAQAPVGPVPHQAGEVVPPPAAQPADSARTEGVAPASPELPLVTPPGSHRSVVSDPGRVIEATLAHCGWQHIDVQPQGAGVWAISGCLFQVRPDTSSSSERPLGSQQTEQTRPSRPRKLVRG